MQYFNTKEFQIDCPTVVSIGKFDGLHKGHRKLLAEMFHWKERGMKVAVFTFSTPPGALVKGRMQPMIMTNEERYFLLRQAGVDYLVEYPFTEEVKHMEPERFVAEILTGQMNAEVIVAGPDCRFGYQAAGDMALLEALQNKYGYRFSAVEKERDGDRVISSTYIREMLTEGNIKKANALLGYPYFISGPVVHGSSLGHKKLYPTANLLPPAKKHLPRYGVYASRVHVDGEVYGGLSNVGEKPTISGKNPAGVETYLYNFEGNLYEKKMRVELLEFIRPEKRFSSIGELRRQLDADIAAGDPKRIAAGY